MKSDQVNYKKNFKQENDELQVFLQMPTTSNPCKLKPMETLGYRIDLRLSELGLNQTDLAKRLGVTPQSVQQWVKNITTPRGKRLDTLAQELMCSKEWLLFGKPDSSLDLTSPALIKIPVLNVSLAAGIGACIDQELVEDWIQIPQDFLWNGINQSSLVVVSVKGDSMLPRLRDGDQLLIDISNKQPVSGNVYAIATEDELRVKRLLKRTDGSWIISSDNKADPAYQDEVIPPYELNNLRIIGRAVKVLMGDI